MTSGSRRMRRTAALAFSSSTCSVPPVPVSGSGRRPSGITWKTEPSVTSSARIGGFSGPPGEAGAGGGVGGGDGGFLGVAHGARRRERGLLARSAGTAVPEGQRQALLRCRAEAAGDLEHERHGEQAQGPAQGVLDEG